MKFYVISIPRLRLYYQNIYLTYQRIIQTLSDLQDGVAKEMVDDLKHQSFLGRPSLGDLRGLLGCV